MKVRALSSNCRSMLGWPRLAAIFSVRSLALRGLSTKLSAPDSCSSMILSLSAVVVMTMMRNSGNVSLNWRIRNPVSPMVGRTRSMKMAGFLFSANDSLMILSARDASGMTVRRPAWLMARSLMMVRMSVANVGSSDKQSAWPLRLVKYSLTTAFCLLSRCFA